MLTVGLYASYAGTLVFDFTPFVTDLTFSTDEHGFAACRLFAPLPDFESFYLYNRAGLPVLRITDNGQVIWEGRVEDPHITSEGIELGALGYYRALSDQPYTAVHTSVSADDIVDALLASAPLLSTNTALIQDPGVTISESYDDKKPSEVLDRLVRLGDSQTPPRVWEACVWEQRMLTFQPRGASGRAWYVDVSEIDIERTLQTLYNSAYGIYYDASNVRAVSSTSTDQPSVNRWGLTRRQAANAQTRSSTVASKVRDTVIEDGREPAPRAQIDFDALFDAAGARWPLWYARSGDTITIRNLPPFIAIAVNRIRTFRILQTSYDAIADKLKVTPESPLATLEEQLSGGPTNSPSSRSSPLGRVNDRIDSIEQEIHGGPGGGGGGGAGGGGSYLVPTGAIVAFTTSCPAGWSEYTAARGRVIVGTPSGGTDEGTVGSALTNLGTRTISTAVAHTHAVGTLVNAAESSHTHGAGSYANATESAHTHDVNPANTTSTAGTSHTHAVDPPATDSGNASVQHTHSGTTATDQHSHAIDLFSSGANTPVTNYGGNFGSQTGTQGAGGVIATDTHSHTITTGVESAAHVHSVNIASFTSGAETAHTHDVNIANTTSTGGTSHTHTFSGTSGAGSSHNHTISGSTASTGSATVDVTMPYIQLTWCQKD